MGFMGRVGEEVRESGNRRVVREGRVGWRGGEGKKKKGRGKDDGDGERWGWNGVCVYDCTDVNEYTRFTNEKE